MWASRGESVSCKSNCETAAKRMPGAKTVYVIVDEVSLCALRFFPCLYGAGKGCEREAQLT